MATWDDVQAVADGLPGAVASTAYGRPAWKVRDRLFVWDRPLTERDAGELGDAAPTGSVVGVRVADDGVKQALLAAEPAAFTVHHLDGAPIVLLDLEAVDSTVLRELVVESWAQRAAPAVVREHLGS